MFRAAIFTRQITCAGEPVSITTRLSLGTSTVGLHAASAVRLESEMMANNRIAVGYTLWCESATVGDYRQTIYPAHRPLSPVITKN
ncbi:hypothetical protein WG908_06390 [Sphingobium sp. AN641]|uniref:hypothetical protein n=1 Tax=Sphingobium sp. AN641 TaxID=3133443 RepID=UPI0030C4C798